jgi:hypothetical protein
LAERLTDQNLTSLRQISFSANRRLLRVQTISHGPIRGAQAFTELASRSVHLLGMIRTRTVDGLPNKPATSGVVPVLLQLDK